MIGEVSGEWGGVGWGGVGWGRVGWGEGGGDLDSDAIDLSDPAPHEGRQHADEVLTEKYGGPELLGGGLKSGGHVDIRGEVGGINLILGADGALNGPPHMQTKAHSYLQRVHEGCSFLSVRYLHEGGILS